LSVYKETCIDQMTAPMRMEEDRSHMTEEILNLTLEIIYLLTGERFPVSKSADPMTITVPSCDSLKPERHNMEKILEVTKKMMELLTGEEPQTVRDGAGPSYSSYPEEPQTVRDGAGPSYSSYPEEPQTVREGAGPSYSSYPEEPQTVRDGAVLPTDKRFSCTECGKCFHFRSKLNEHKRSHTDEKPYSCLECGKCFKFRFKLNEHKITHTGEKPYSCPECGKCFVQKANL
ncbi:hypothetical protein AB205_0207040, partial [Aquarana catesbeiana]